MDPRGQHAGVLGEGVAGSCAGCVLAGLVCVASRVFVQVDDVLKSESARVDLYLHSSTRPKLMAIVRSVFLSDFMKELLEKEGSGMRALLKDVPPQTPEQPVAAARQTRDKARSQYTAFVVQAACGYRWPLRCTFAAI